MVNLLSSHSVLTRGCHFNENVKLHYNAVSPDCPDCCSISIIHYTTWVFENLGTKEIGFYLEKIDHFLQLKLSNKKNSINMSIC